MPLLIRWTEIREKHISDIYIPLCLYLYWKSSKPHWCSSKFTFHYASTYTANAMNMITWICNLHSTMPLLIRGALFGAFAVILIYIPLCLYLYAGAEYIGMGVLMIYIPLCLYLYGWICPQYAGAQPFTFHYASTYTRGILAVLKTQKLFTFHYASTYTAPVYAQLTVIVSFTFHYASTYTVPNIVVTSPCVKIYIPLCLYLYPVTFLSCVFSLYIYIPLCLYLYKPASAFPLPLLRIYIPLCLYLYQIGVLFLHFNSNIYIPLCLYLYA